MIIKGDAEFRLSLQQSHPVLLVAKSHRRQRFRKNGETSRCHQHHVGEWPCLLQVSVGIVRGECLLHHPASDDPFFLRWLLNEFNHGFPDRILFVCQKLHLLHWHLR